MPQERICAECNERNAATAQFCRYCGRSLDAAVSSAGRASHPNPIRPPDGFCPVECAADLHYRMESVSGGPTLIGTESMRVVLWNAGYALRDVVIRVIGRDEAWQLAVDVEKSVTTVARGQEVRIEVPSYDIELPVKSHRVSLVSAEFV
ncbi:MAG: hypothetical protein KF841_09985 [Phycisphaerae bacterium]|nr:hypothetical protein [Phycisphaerae bacterium]